MKQRPLLLLLLVMTILSGCNKAEVAGDSPKSSDVVDKGLGALKTLANARGIRIGSYYDSALRSETHDKIFEEEFNAMTVFFGVGVTYLDNSKDPIFSETDRLVSRATTLGMEVFGQSLVWFEDIPGWVKETPLGQVEAAMFTHIDSLVAHTAGRIKLWNVVNEAIDENGAIRLKHRWAEAMGADDSR